MKQKHQRLIFILIGLICLAVATGLILKNFQDNLVFYYSPSDLGQKHVPQNKMIRVGGLIKEKSFHKLDDGLTNEFIITDLQNDITVRYKGLLPPMFREGQGTVAKGTLSSDGAFIAEQLLTKHDEKYMPREVTESLRKSGQWRENK